jgi:hypothetical protein
MGDVPTTMRVSWTPFFACFLPRAREAMGEAEACLSMNVLMSVVVLNAENECTKSLIIT